MIINDIKLPFYAKATIIILGLSVFFAILYILQGIIVPVVFSIIFAIVLHPVVNFIVRFKINRILAIILTLLLTFLVVAAFCLLFYSQALRFSDSWPILVDKFTLLLNESVTYCSKYLDLDPKRINDWILTTKNELFHTSSAAIGQTILTLGSTVMILCLIPFYVFIILYYEPLLLEFVRRLFISSNQHQVSEIITQIKNVIQHYLAGLAIEGIMVAVMNSIALFALGVEYAILLGVIGALLNVIPYIGGLVAVALPMIVAIVTKTSAWYALYVLAAYYFIQIIDNNYIVPYIVASKVKINALFSIIVIFAGNALWGIPGMFLSIPLLAIIKVIFDHIEPLKPWGFLLGDTMPPLLNIKPIIKKIKLNDFGKKRRQNP